MIGKFDSICTVHQFSRLKKMAYLAQFSNKYLDLYKVRNYLKTQVVVGQQEKTGRPVYYKGEMMKCSTHYASCCNIAYLLEQRDKRYV